MQLTPIQINPSIFREYDIRGIAGRDLSAALAERIGYAYCSFISARSKKPLSEMTISVGRDCRLTSDEYADALIQSLRDCGVRVLNLGVCPTPLTYFSVFHLGLDGGIMITGSHNPADYNGFKICVGRDTLHGHDIQELRKIIESCQRPARGSGPCEPFEIIPAYVNYLIQNAKKLRPLKIVLDAGNGTAATVAPALFSRLGAKIIPLFCELDGRFPNHHPDPTVPANLSDLVQTVLKNQADFGVAFDGDSDRIGLVDETGRIIYGDELMVLLSRDVLKSNPGATIISEVKSSHRLYADIARNGGKPLMWKTGHSLIKSKMKETGAALAGEMSGHIFFADRYFGFDDAIYAALRVYEIASAHSGRLSELLADLPPSVSTPEIRVDCQEDKKFRLVEAAKRRLAPGRKVTDIDGVRIDLGDAWGLIRASNTQPVLVLRFEAPTEARLNEVRELFLRELRNAAIEVGHPEINLTHSAH
ncbi:MAG: phosphomannomutase/phosphoglucomutase [Bdellovibrionales bacterium]|nr:phosphomannomutase/phosphoglucomutase [Bdellovibrionales bacterium]